MLEFACYVWKTTTVLLPVDTYTAKRTLWQVYLHTCGTQIKRWSTPVVHRWKKKKKRTESRIHIAANLATYFAWGHCEWYSRWVTGHAETRQYTSPYKFLTHGRVTPHFCCNMSNATLSLLECCLAKRNLCPLNTNKQSDKFVTVKIWTADSTPEALGV